MSTTASTDGAKLGQAKKFDDLTPEQQIQAMRQEIRHLHSRMAQMDMIAGIARCHSHSNLGQVTIPVTSMNGNALNFRPLE